MNFQARKLKIISMLEKEELLDVKILAKKLNISEITIRRDLNILAKDGLIIRTHGGAMIPKLAHLPVSFTQKAAKNSYNKDVICRKAASLIKEGDVIFLDCGSTVFRICPLIKNLKIKVLTNSLPILNELLNSEVSINFIGGEIDFERQAAHGKIAVEHIKRYKATKAFVGIDGISVKNGLSASSEKEAETCLAINENSNETYFLGDSTKIGIDRYFSFAPINIVKNLITDNTIDVATKLSLEQVGIKVW